jgi:DNA-binding SARP family transcriptional activator/predicted ATPase
MLRIQLLGQFKLQANDDPLRLPSRHTQSLLAYLLLHLGKSHRREMVAGILWPDIEEEKARARLRYAIWQLRKELGEEYLLADKIEVSFNTGSDYWLDVAAFDGPVFEELSLLELQQAMDVYGGDLLPGFYEDWIALERDRLAASYGNGMELLLVRLVGDGKWREAVEWAERWISRGHSPEVAYRALMVAHNQLGDVSSALMAYKRCQQALEDQLAVEPSAETQQIFEMISAGERPDAWLPQKAVVPQKFHSQHLPPTSFSSIAEQLPEDVHDVFLARESELSQLKINLDRAVSGQGRVLFLRGDAGRGKTSILAEFSRKALEENENLLVLWGGGEAYTGLGDPFLPFRDVLALLTCDFERLTIGGGLSREGARRLWGSFAESLEAILDVGPDLIGSFLSGEALLDRATSYGIESAGGLGRLEDRVASNQDRPRSVNIQHRDTQKDLFEQYTRVVQRMAKRHPLIIVLDDLHWVDLGSINLLFHLGRRIRGHSILILGSYRPIEAAREIDGVESPLARVVNELKRVYGEIEIDLEQTDERSRRNFVDIFLDSEPNQFDESFRRAFFTHTGGHPLFTVELLRQMQAKDEIRKDDAGRWVVRSSVDWDELPAKVDAVIAGRIDQVPSPLRNILRIASIEGEEFTTQVLASVSGLEEGEILDHLSRELAGQYNLIEAQGNLRVDKILMSRYRFRHHLFHTYVYNALDVVERAYLHREVGNAIEALYGEMTDDMALRLARHFEIAGNLEKAAGYFLKAGNVAKRLSNNQDAITHLSKALDLIQTLPESPERARKELALNIALGAPLVATMGYTAPEAEQTYERARELCYQIDDPPQLATALWGLWSFYLVRARYEIAEQLAEQILELSQAGSDPDLLLVADWTLGITSVHLGEFERARKHLDGVLSVYDAARHGDLTYIYGQNPGVTCMIYSAFALWFLGYPDQASERSQMALRSAVESGHEYSLAFAHSMASVYYAITKEAEESLHHAQEATSRAKKAGFPFLLAAGFAVKGWARAYMGKESMTIRSMRRGLATMRVMGADLGRPIFLALLSETYGRRGQIEEGLAIADEAMEVTRANKELMYQSELQRLQGELIAMRGEDNSGVISSFRQAADTAREQKARILELRALTSLAQFQKSQEPDTGLMSELSKIYGWFGEGFESVDLVRARELLDD